MFVTGEACVLPKEFIRPVILGCFADNTASRDLPHNTINGGNDTTNVACVAYCLQYVRLKLLLPFFLRSSYPSVPSSVRPSVRPCYGAI